MVLLGLNLRTVFASLPPLLDDVRGDLGLSAAVAGLVTTGPVLCFGLLAPLAPRVVRRYSMEQTLVACAAATAAGAALRGAGGAAGLFAGAVLAGAGVAIAQTVLPALLVTRFAGHTGPLTGAFSMALTLGATLAAGVAVPLERLLGGWRAALGAFAVPAALAAFLWVPPALGRATRVQRELPLGLLRDRRAWAVALYFGLQSMAFYGGLTWLPSVLRHAGYSEAAAGGLQAFASACQLLPAFVVPVVAGRRPSQTPVLLVLVALAAGGLAGIALAPGAALLWMAAIGVGQGGSLGLALMLPVLRGRGAHAVSSLTAMALSLGYLVAASGPWLVGLAHDLSGGWDLPVAVLVAVTVAELAAGVPATRPWRVGRAGPVASPAEATER